jgi:hypothetical protein
LLKSLHKKCGSMHFFDTADRFSTALQISCISSNIQQILLTHQIEITSEVYQYRFFSFSFSIDHRKMVHLNHQFHNSVSEHHYRTIHNILFGYYFHNKIDSSISKYKGIRLHQTLFFLAVGLSAENFL